MDMRVVRANLFIINDILKPQTIALRPLISLFFARPRSQATAVVISMNKSQPARPHSERRPSNITNP